MSSAQGVLPPLSVAPAFRLLRTKVKLFDAGTRVAGATSLDGNSEKGLLNYLDLTHLDLGWLH